MKKKEKIVVCSRSFGRKVTKLEELNESATTHCLNAAEKIRSDNQTTKRITVFIRTSPFQKDKNYYANSKDIDLPIRTNDSIELVKQVLIALKYIYKKGYKYQKVGIILSELNDVNIYKKNLFSSISSEEKRKKLMEAIDYTNIKYGRHALSVAQAGLKKKWNIKRQHSSKLIQRALVFYPPLRSLRTSILLIFSKELFNSSIFSREETLIIKNKKIRTANIGNAVTIERLV